MSIFFENERRNLRPKQNFHSFDIQRTVHRDIFL